MKTSVFAFKFFALSHITLAQINVIGLPDAGNLSAVTKFDSTATGADTVGAVVHVWYATHHSGLVYDSAVVVAVGPGGSSAEGGQSPGDGGPLWRLKIAGNTAATSWVFEGCTPLASGLFEIACVEISLPSSRSAFDRNRISGLSEQESFSRGLHNNGAFTEGSGPGITFANGAGITRGTGPMMVTYRYVNPMTLFSAVIGAGPPKGDVFENLDLSFYDAALAPGGFDGSSRIEFAVDTDRFVPSRATCACSGSWLNNDSCAW
ncbi:hypothetical protein OAF37_04250 [Rubripirellula sp.]|nr:hypothetical protein [Rubripirellula sp.]MDB4393711.1 hypothetical protein [Rhodopirellula sp.]MDB4645244.1 hypothetical protein [Rubripirellula sp.]